MSYFDSKLPVLDLEMLATLRSLDEDKGFFLNELIELYRLDSPVIFENLLKAHAEASVKHVVFYAHRLKGMSSNLGILRFYRLLESIEKSYTQLSPRELLEMEDLLRQEYELALAQLVQDWCIQNLAS